MSETQMPDLPPLKAAVLIDLIPKPDPVERGLEVVGTMGRVGMGLLTLSLLLALLTALHRHWVTLWGAVAGFVLGVWWDLVKHGWEGVIMGVFLLGLLVSLATLIVLVVVMTVSLKEAGHRRVEKLDRDMEREDESAALLSAHSPERLAARSRRLKLEIQFYERGATKFGLATGVSAAIALLTPVFPPEWKTMIDNFRYLPSALALGLGLGAFLLHHRADILMRAEFLVGEALALSLTNAGSKSV